MCLLIHCQTMPNGNGDGHGTDSEEARRHMFLAEFVLTVVIFPFTV